TGGLISAPRDPPEAFFQHCDPGKISRYRPFPNAIEGTFQSAKTLVEHTAEMHVLGIVAQSGEAVLLGLAVPISFSCCSLCPYSSICANSSGIAWPCAIPRSPTS